MHCSTVMHFEFSSFFLHVTTLYSCFSVLSFRDLWMLISDLSFCSRFHFDCCQPPTTFAQHGFNCPQTSFSLVVVSYGAIFSRDILPPGQSSPTLDSFTHTQSRASSLARPSRLPRQRGQSAPQSPHDQQPHTGQYFVHRH